MTFKKDEKVYWWIEDNLRDWELNLRRAFAGNVIPISKKTFGYGIFRTKKAAMLFRKELKALVNKYWGK